MEVLFVIDMLNDFMPRHIYRQARLAVEPAGQIIPNVKKLTEQARRWKIPIFYLNDCHELDDPEFSRWPPHAVKGTRGAQVVKPLAPHKGDWIIGKKTYDGFTNPQLDKELKRLGVRRIYETGVVTAICVYETARGALARGYEVVVIEDAVAGLASQRDGLDKIKKLGVQLITTDKLIERWSAQKG
jgi:nicotinamidase-related amidase